MVDDLQVIDELDLQASVDFDAFISENYPWLPTRMDFSRIPGHTHFSWGQADDEETTTFFRDTHLAEFEYVAVLLSVSEPMRVYRFTDATENLDLIAENHEIYLIVGVTRNATLWQVESRRFAYIHTGRDIWVVDKL